MQSNINEILEKIERLKQELQNEYENLREKYFYAIKHGKVVFPKNIRKYHKTFKRNLLKYIFTANVRHVLSIPFIYGMIIPMLILDLFLTVYQLVAFTLYRIPKVKRKDYIVFDSRYLGYLNLMEKFNCLYCNYGNGLLAYSTEIAARTERYWCPIKHADKIEGIHRWHSTFADYGDAEGFREMYTRNDIFNNVEKKNSADNQVESGV